MTEPRSTNLLSKDARVTAVSISENHTFSKFPCESITLLAGLGVRGDAHCGDRVKHRSRVAADPSQPNLRQIHLIHAELHDELREKGFSVAAGIMGENITTRGIDLLALPRNTLIHIGDHVVIEVTGLRNPCKQLDNYQTGLLAAVLDRNQTGEIIRKSGIMGIVIEGGLVKAGCEIRLTIPDELRKLERV